MKLKTHLILFCGLACSGKSTISKRIAKVLVDRGIEVENIELDSYIKAKFPKENFIFDIETRLNLDQIVANDLEKRKHGDKVFIIDAGNPLEKGRNIYKQAFPDMLVVLVDTPLLICFWRDARRSLAKEAPVGNWIYLRSLVSKVRKQKKYLIQGISIPFERPVNPDLSIKPNANIQKISKKVVDLVLCQPSL